MRGIISFFGGVAFVVGTPRLWPKAIVPVLTALVLTTVFGVLGVREAIELAQHSLGAGLMSGLVAFALGVAAVVLAAILGISLAQPLSGWALDAIVRAQQESLGLPSQGERGGLGAALSSLGSALFAMAVGIPAVLMLTVVGWVFPPATVVTVPLKVLVASALLAWDLLDYPLSSVGLTFGKRLRWCAGHAGSVIGFGLSAALVFAVPGLGLLALPAASRAPHVSLPPIASGTRAKVRLDPVQRNPRGARGGYGPSFATSLPARRNAPTP